MEQRYATSRQAAKSSYICFRPMLEQYHHHVDHFVNCVLRMGGPKLSSVMATSLNRLKRSETVLRLVKVWLERGAQGVVGEERGEH